jgi:hypothetical protein
MYPGPVTRSTIAAALALLTGVSIAALHGQNTGAVEVPAIRSEAIRTHMEFLASDRLEGRGTGTRGYQEAAEYVARQFQSLGLERPFAGTYFQPVALRHTEAIPSQSSLLVRGSGHTRRFAFGTDFVSNGDLHRRSVSIEAPVIFVGDGINAPAVGYDDYATVDVRGKIAAIVLRAIPRLSPTQSAYFGNLDRRIEAAIAHGAVGFLYLSPDNTFPWERNLQLATRGLTSAVARSGAPLEPSKPLAVAVLRYESSKELFALGAENYDNLLARHRDEPVPALALPVTMAVHVESRHSRLRSPNVAGVLRGSDPTLRREFVIVIAHLDHLGRGRPVAGDDIYNGAIDNASGVAALLAMAQTAVTRRDRPRRSLLFLVTTGEEMPTGMLGAKFFVAAPAVPLNDIVAVINSDGPTLMLSPVARINAQGGEDSTLGLVSSAVAQRMGMELRLTASRNVGDQVPFIMRGVPAVWPLADAATQPDADAAVRERRWMAEVYHSPKDDLNRTFDFGAAVTMAQFNLMVAWTVAEETPRPQWNPRNLFGSMATAAGP